MQKFKIGDRVVVYGAAFTKEFFKGKKMKVIYIFTDDELLVKAMDRDLFFSVHPKQCRRLIPKKRRRIYVQFNSRGIDNVSETRMPEMLGCEVVEYVEVRRKSKKK